MVSPWQSALMSLALFFLLCWTTSSARSHNPTCSDPSPPYRVKRDLSPSTREQVDASSQVVKDSLNLVSAVTFWTQFKTASAVMKGLAEFPRLVPCIGGLVSSLVNVVLAFIPQEDTVLKELKEGFAEVNRKLDSLSKQISNLAMDVEWFNYASVYSQDEVRILNTWNKFNEFRENSELVQSEENKLRLAQIFTNYYENTGVEASVANLYHSLTVNDTSLSGNINQLLRKKLKCGIGGIGRYNLYFSSLLWKGMVLNQLYWNLMGFNSSEKEGEHVQMFKKIYEAQRRAVEFCLDNYEQYMKNDVVEIAKSFSPDDKSAIAARVKQALGEKYDWYDWVVLVYDSRHDYVLLELTEIPVGRLTVAVGFTVKTGEKIDEDLQFAGSLCYYNKDCRLLSIGVRACLATWPELKFEEKVKVTHVTFGEDFAEVPEPGHTVQCVWNSRTGKTSMYYSRSWLVCNNACKNGGTCWRLLKSNEWLCECPDGFYGDRCEVKIAISKVPTSNTHHVPDLTSIDAKLKAMEAKLEKKLEEILSSINGRCPHQ